MHGLFQRCKDTEYAMERASQIELLKAIISKHG